MAPGLDQSPGAISHHVRPPGEGSHVNDHHSSKDNLGLPQISTGDLALAVKFIDDMIDTIRESRSAGGDLDVEKLTVMMLVSARCSGAESDIIIVQQALLLSIALQRLV